MRTFLNRVESSASLCRTTWARLAPCYLVHGSLYIGAVWIRQASVVWLFFIELRLMAKKRKVEDIAKPARNEPETPRGFVPPAHGLKCWRKNNTKCKSQGKQQISCATLFLPSGICWPITLGALFGLVLFVLVVCFPLSAGSLYALSSSGLTYVRCCPEARTTGTFIAGRPFPSWCLGLICGIGGKRGSRRFSQKRDTSAVLDPGAITDHHSTRDASPLLPPVAGRCECSVRSFGFWPESNS